MDNFLDEVMGFQAKRSAHQRSYNLIQGDQTFTENMLDALSLDTAAGQLRKTLQLRFEHDAWGKSDLDYNVFSDDDITGYEHIADDFIKSTSPAETQVIKDLYDHNIQLRHNLKNHGFARFMGNLLDPINLIPIPIAKGLGFVKGAKVGGLAVGGVMGVAESGRALLDPTNPWWEPYIAISGGALFGAAIGGGVGAMRSNLDIHLAGEKAFDFWNMQEARQRVHDAGDIEIAGIKPYVDIRAGENRFSHLQRIVEKSPEETRAQYGDRIGAIAKSEDKYNDVISVSRLHNPDEFASTFTKLERSRFQQHPFFLLKNTMFKGEFGNAWRILADRIAGTPGMHTKGSIAGTDAIAQGVFNKMQLHNTHITAARDELYNAYRRSQGMKQKEDLTPGQQVFESAWDVASFKYKNLPEFYDKVNRAYLEFDYKGTKPSDPHVAAGVEALGKYWDEMGKLGVKAGVFGVIRGQKDLLKAVELIAENQRFLRNVLDGDPTSPNRAFRMGRKKVSTSKKQALAKKERKLSGLVEQEKALGLTDPGQRQLKADIEQEVQQLRRELSEIDPEIEMIEAYLRDPDKFFTSANRPDSGFYPSDNFSGAGKLRNVLSRHREILDTKARLVEWGAMDPKTGKVNPDIALPRADVWARAHMPRVWHRETVFNHREELTQILHDWYTSRKFSSDELAAARRRADETIDTILKQKEPGAIKRSIDDAIENSGIPVSLEQRAKIHNEIDDLFKKKITKGYTRINRVEELRAIVARVTDDIPFDDAVKAEVFKDLKIIEDMAAVGHPEGFGASVSTLERRLDIPSALLIKADGSGPSKATVNFIETNPELLMQNYHRRMSASIEMALEFGDPTMKGHFDSLRLQLQEMEAKAPKADQKALRLEGEKMLQAASDLKEKVLGVYRIPQDPTSLGNRTVRSLKNWMVLALMGKATIAALADVGRGAMSVGLGQTFEMGFRRFGAAARDFQMAGKEVGEAGEAAEMALHGRFESMFDLEGYRMGSSAGMVEKFFQGGVNKMFVLNVLAPYTDVMKRFFGGMIQSNMVKASIQWAGTVKAVQKENGEVVLEGVRGGIAKSDRDALTKNGIGFEDAVAIASQFRKYGEMGDHLHLANTRLWDDLVIQKKFRTALVGEVNNAVITPGVAEKLNFMATPVGSLMTQFKSFALSATHRTLLAGLQQRDARAFHGVLSMIVMGYMVDLIKSPTYDKRDFLSLDRFVQAVDYSGATGILFDLNNMLEFLSASDEGNFHIGIRPWLGVESFWKDPNLAQRTGQVGGPAASLFGDFIYSTFFSDKNSDVVRSLRRLTPFNNVIWWTFIIDRLQRSAGQSLDRKEE